MPAVYPIAGRRPMAVIRMEIDRPGRDARAQTTRLAAADRRSWPDAARRTGQPAGEGSASHARSLTTQGSSAFASVVLASKWP